MKFRVSFHITHSSSHWSNEAIVIYYLKKLIFLRFEKRKGLKLEKNAKTLLIFDVFKGQTTSVVNELLQKNDVVVIYVPKNNTNVFLPLDISVNKSVKCYLSSKYQDWHGDKGIRAVEQRC